MTKTYDVFNGVALDPDWLQHVATCEACRGFDCAKPATMANMCLEGSILWKRENILVKPKLPDLETTKVSRAKAKLLMRYKEI